MREDKTDFGFIGAFLQVLQGGRTTDIVGSDPGV